MLARRFGKIDFESRALPFALTDYYQPEFGIGLQRVFISFKRLVDPEELAQIKALTNRMENRFSAGNKRLVNIDPGYLNLAKLVLASTKDYVHRIYLGKGIYAETTLFFRGKGFQAWEWTYPDFRAEGYRDIFNQIREIFYQQVNNE